jgi:thiamine-phosphate pyrophosphorylase
MSDLVLPRLLLIADHFTDPVRAERIVEAVQAGVRWVQLRDHKASVVGFREAAGSLMARLRALRPGLRVSINTRVEAARDLGAGLHLGHRGPSPGEARQILGPDAVLGVSVHDDVEGKAAVRAGVDYVTFSPVFATSSKPGHPGTGLDTLASFCGVVSPAPVYALGGITPGRVAPCQAVGAYGVAVLSGILEADDPALAVAAYCDALDRT